MKWRSPRVLIPFILLLLLLVSGGLWIYLRNGIQKSPSVSTNWVHVPPGANPTPPSDGYLFKDATGGYVVYHLPATPPAPITWNTYNDQQDGYALDVPSNWEQVETAVGGHPGFAYYPPGTDLNENVPGGAKGIGFRWTTAYQPPSSTDPSITEMQSITINGITGELYTQSSLGNSIIASFPLHGGNFVISVDADSDLLIYVFHHMLESLKFS